uniref:Zgc:101569 n=1 Tax=Sinocyclocheilus rhinocerous TaxID=307959 RepID=A0A673JPB4_9TELE
MEEWRHWLEGLKHPFVVLTDHKNLEYLQSAKRLNPRQTRWALFFTRFDFSVTYRPGSRNTKADALWILTLLTPRYTRNAVNQETARRLTEELLAFDQDNSLNVAVLYGVGGNFCAGFDLKELAQSSGSLKLEQDVCCGPGPMGPSRMRLSKPLIAEVSVYAVAGGLELAMLADLRVVEESSIMGVFCRRFGVPLIDGGTVRLPQLIVLSRALDLILTGRPVKAQEALTFGLANRVVPDGQALQVALELAEQVSAFPQLCLRADHNSAYHAVFDSSSFTQAMQYEFDHGLPVVVAEAVTGATKFSLGAGRGGTFSKSKL